MMMMMMQIDVVPHEIHTTVKWWPMQVPKMTVDALLQCVLCMYVLVVVLMDGILGRPNWLYRQAPSCGWFMWKYTEEVTERSAQTNKWRWLYYLRNLRGVCATKATPTHLEDEMITYYYVNGNECLNLILIINAIINAMAVHLVRRHWSQMALFVLFFSSPWRRQVEDSDRDFGYVSSHTYLRTIHNCITTRHYLISSQ